MTTGEVGYIGHFCTGHAILKFADLEPRWYGQRYGYSVAIMVPGDKPQTYWANSLDDFNRIVARI
jgi:hypothetical protein